MIVKMPAPPCLKAAEAKVTETKGSLSINSAITSSFSSLSHAKHQTVHWAERDANNYRLTPRCRWRVTLQAD